jgi:RNA polymerase sigma factor (sigma-70 family)
VLMEAGSPGADATQDALIQAYFDRRPNLVRFFAARTGSYAMAEDLAQDLYLKLASGRPAIEASAPVALLYRMAINLMLDSARSARRSAVRETAWRLESRTALAGTEIAEEPAADEVVVSRQRLRQLMEAVSELPPQRRRAFRLHRLEGLSQAQTAQAMGVSVKAIEQHISAALKALALKVRP